MPMLFLRGLREGGIRVVDEAGDGILDGESVRGLILRGGEDGRGVWGRKMG